MKRAWKMNSRGSQSKLIEITELVTLRGQASALICPRSAIGTDEQSALLPHRKDIGRCSDQDGERIVSGEILEFQVTL
jgi:hypothetical protein